jgi:hypothetical protein
VVGSITNDLQQLLRRIGSSELAPLSLVATAAHGVSQQQASARGNSGQHEYRIESGDRECGQINHSTVTAAAKRSNRKPSLRWVRPIPAGAERTDAIEEYTG